MYCTIRRLTAGNIAEFIGVLRLFDEVFEMMDFKLPEEKYLGGLLDREDFIVFAAIHEDSVIGGLTAHVLPSYYFQSSEVYIYDLAVSSAFQRQGIGRQLMGNLADFCKIRGYREIFVQADAVDKHALEFYHSTGGRPEQVVHFNYPLS